MTLIEFKAPRLPSVNVCSSMLSVNLYVYACMFMFICDMSVCNVIGYSCCVYCGIHICDWNMDERLILLYKGNDLLFKLRTNYNGMLQYG